MNIGKIVKKPSITELKYIAGELKKGKIVVFPTDTVYGIGTSAFCPAAVKKIYKIKGRNYNKPLPLLIDNIKHVRKLVNNIPADVEKLAKKIWPGPLTIIFETSDMGSLLMGGKKTIGVRVPDDKMLLFLIKEMSVPLVATSANVSSKKDCISFKEMDEKIISNADYIIDGGLTKHRVCSTVLDASQYPYVVAREGRISKKEIEKIIWGKNGVKRDR